MMAWRKLLWLCAAAAGVLINLPQTVDAQTRATVDAPAVSTATPAAIKETKVNNRLTEVLGSPDFSRESTMLVPVFKQKDADEPSVWMVRIVRFFGWLAEVLRAGVWVLGAIAIAVFLVSAHYWWRVYAAREKKAVILLPTHIGGLDIRADSLPDAIGQAAWLRWQARDAIGCLSLLYRGALSALVLRFDARIAASSTEAECARAAENKLAPAAQQYFVQLTETWIRAVYAARAPQAHDVEALCTAFDMHFAPRPAVSYGAPQPTEQRA